MKPSLTHSVVVETSAGALVFDLFGHDAPFTVQRFLALVLAGALNGTMATELEHRNTVVFSTPHANLVQDFDSVLSTSSIHEEHRALRTTEAMAAELQRQRARGVLLAPSAVGKPTTSLKTIPFDINRPGLLIASPQPLTSSSTSCVFRLTVTTRHLLALERDCIVFGEVAEGKKIVSDIGVGMAVAGGGDHGRPLKLLRIKRATVLPVSVNPAGGDVLLHEAERWSTALRQRLIERIVESEASQGEEGRLRFSRWVLVVNNRLTYNAHAESDEYLSSGDDDEEDSRTRKRGRGSDDEDATASLHQQKLNQTRALMLRVLNNIPDEDVVAPETVLFVCKLNPLTDAEGLKMCFSQFGAIRSVDLIRDKRTGQSLQYAFVDFMNKESCDRAFHKMDGALIDDSRIHVDFSQSVAKVWSNRRRSQ